MNQLILNEARFDDLEAICETTGNAKSYYIEGIFAQADIKNQNGRVYSKQIMEREVQNYAKCIKEKTSLGELDHPDGPVINLNNVSHLITKLEMEGKDIYGKARMIDTPSGLIGQKLLDVGVKLAVSTRGLGSLTSKGGAQHVNDDFSLVTVDIVQSPSAPDAYVNSIMESTRKGWFEITNSGNLLYNEQIREFKNFLNDL